MKRFIDSNLVLEFFPNELNARYALILPKWVTERIFLVTLIPIVIFNVLFDQKRRKKITRESFLRVFFYTFSYVERKWLYMDTFKTSYYWPFYLASSLFFFIRVNEYNKLEKVDTYIYIIYNHERKIRYIYPRAHLISFCISRFWQKKKNNIMARDSNNFSSAQYALILKNCYLYG